MTDRLQALSDAGVSIWLDDLSRERIETGNLAELIKDKHVVGVTTNPTIFAAAIANGERYDEQVRKLVADGADVDRVIFELTTEDVRNGCDDHDARSPSRPRPTAGSRSRSSPTLANDTEATIASAQKPVAGRRTGPTSTSRSRPPRRGCPAITAAISEGINVNVTLIFSVERYREVMDAYLSGLEAARDAGLDLTPDLLGGVVLRLPRRHRGRQAPRGDRHRRGAGAARQGGGRQRAARLRGVRGGPRERPLEAARGRRRQPAAAAVGVDGREEPRLPRHPLRHRPRRRRHREHDAREDARRLRRPRRGQGRRGVRQGRRGAGASSTSSRAVGIDLDDVFVVLETEGVDKFKKSWDELVETVEKQMEQAASDRGAGRRHDDRRVARLGELADGFQPDLRAWFAEDAERASALTFTAADLHRRPVQGTGRPATCWPRCSRWRSRSASPPAATRCSAASTSTSPRTAPCCTPRCGCPRTRRCERRRPGRRRGRARRARAGSTTSPTRSAPAPGPASPASGSARWSTSASAAPTSAR